MAERRPPDVVVVVGGGALHPHAVDRAAGTRVVVAADSGVDHALAAGLPVHHVVGDLDSVSPQALARVEASGASVHRHPPDKDATDSELALELALELVERSGSASERPELVLVGGGADRLDHLLADVAQLTAPGLEAVEAAAVLGAATCTVVRSGRPRQLVGAPGEQVSLLTPAGPAGGVTTAGLRWVLLDATLGAGSTRGVSNELLGSSATVSCTAGVVLAVQPGTAAPPVAPRATPYDPSPGPTG